MTHDELVQHQLWVLLFTLLSIAAFVIGIMISVIFYDWIIVALIRHLHIRVYPEAINIAMSIYSRPDTWTGDKMLQHAHVGTIDARYVKYLDVETRHGTWKPNAIERRIIFEAASWHYKQATKIRTDRIKGVIMQGLAQPVIAKS
jgi:hypothetical protein